MPIGAPCGSCRQTFRVTDSLAGRTVRCPGCKKPVRIPGAEPISAPEDDVKVLKSGRKQTVKLPPELAENTLSDEQRAAIDSELTAGERVIWSGRPDPPLLLWQGLPVAAVLLIMGMVVLGFGISEARKQSWFGLGMMVVGLGLGGYGTYHPFGVRRAGRKRVYALTNRRAMVLTMTGLEDASVENYYPADITQFRRRDWWFCRDGAGDVIFRSITVISQTTYRNNQGDTRTETRKTTTHYGFLAIRHARSVERLVRETLLDPLLDKLYE